ncbi:MAG: GNAT family N-acetyltransferase [Clostridiales bacterium]|jgi:predicted acetyltransferase|nr:GNAT family N-acetyltransferase [Clostridiales bacterium]
MVIRKIKPEENVASKMVESVAFVGGPTPEDFTEQVNNPMEHTEGYENIWAAFTDDNIMTSRVVINQLSVMFDGNSVPMGGVGGVASLPEYRTGGAVKKIMLEAMKEMKEKGQVFSYLYPFSHKYYRQFGYEICFERRCVTFELSLLRSLKPQGYLTFYQKGEDLKPYMDIYKKFISGFNLAVARDEKGFKNFMEKDPYTTRKYTYLWHNDGGEAKSYLTFTGEMIAPYEMKMQINELAWADSEGFIGMLSLLGRFDAQMKEAFWEVPPNADLHSVVAEPYELNINTHCGGMNRIIDVHKALELMKAPMGSGNIVISVSDSFLEWNNKTYEILWENERISVRESAKEPDANISVQTLVQLVCGYASACTAQLAGNLTILKNEDNFKKLFIKKNLFITDRF